VPNDLVGKTAAIIAADGFEDLELFHPMYRLQEEGTKTMVIGLTMDPIKGKKGYSIKPNASIDEVSAVSFDFLVVPGGKSPEKLRLNQKILRFVKDLNAQGKPIAAICHAGQVLASAGVVKNRALTCVAGIRDDMINAGARYVDKIVVIDGNLVTSRVPSDLPEFARATIEVFRKPQLLQAPRPR
jgi:PfpI family intracellular protease